jgi:uncharacterized protein YukJ
VAVIYGVLRGKVDRWKREDPLASARTFAYLQIRVLDGTGKPWRVPVNVRSSDPDKSLVIVHRVDRLLNHPILASLGTFAPGLTDLQKKPRSAANALDYVRAPLFDLTTGIALPPTGPGDDDDLQDVVGRQLNDLKARGGELFVFGSHVHDPAPKPGIDAEFGTADGMHDVHMNQGNAKGDHDEDNGVFSDGGLILRFPDHLAGLFFRFKTQWLPTDHHGNRVPGASKEIPSNGVIIRHPPHIPDDPHPTFPDVFVDSALINPGGDDPGREVVVIGNATLKPLDLTGWSLVDKNGATQTLSMVSVPPGGSAQVVLSSDSVQLSNRGGTISLVNPDGVLVQEVSYSRSDAVENRFVRFTT